MLRRKALITALGATLAAGGMAVAPAAHADRIGFNLSFAGPGYGVTVGNAPYYYGPRYHDPYRHWRRAYVPAPVYVAPPVVYRAPVVVAPAPVYYPSGRLYYRY